MSVTGCVKDRLLWFWAILQYSHSSAVIYETVIKVLICIIY